MSRQFDGSDGGVDQSDGGRQRSYPSHNGDAEAEARAPQRFLEVDVPTDVAAGRIDGDGQREQIRAVRHDSHQPRRPEPPLQDLSHHYDVAERDSTFAQSPT